MTKSESKKSSRTSKSRGDKSGKSERGQQRRRSFVPRKKKLSADENVPMLTFGQATNFAEFQEALSTACLEKYGDLGRLIEDDEYYKPDEVKKSDHDPPLKEDGSEEDDADVISVYRATYLEAIKQRLKDIAKMKSDRSSMYAYIKSKLSTESDNEVKRHPKYGVFNKAVCPLELWLAVKERHLITTTSQDARIIKQTAAQDYSSLRQGAFESLIDFKRKFDLKYKAYVSLGNHAKDEEDQAMDFLNALDKSRYGNFVCDILNGVQMEAIKVPKNVEEVFNKANSRLEVRRSKTEGASYSTINHTPRKPKGDKKNGNKNGKPKEKPDDKDDSEKSGGDEKKKRPKKTERVRRCFRCGSTDHMIKDCPEESDEDNDNIEKKLAGMTCVRIEDVVPLAGLTLVEDHGYSSKSSDDSEDYENEFSETDSGSSSDQWTSEDDGEESVEEKVEVSTYSEPVMPWEIAMDNGSQVSIVHPRFLTNLQKCKGKFSGLVGDAAETVMKGTLPGFFDCLCSDSARISILSQADVEDNFDVQYIPGISYTVRVGNEDIVFERRNKLYVADFSDWVRDNYKESKDMLAGMTVSEREHMYTRKERRKAIEAGEFIKNAGFPSQGEAIAMARDGNLKNFPHDANDIKRHFEIYGDSPAYLRGKMTDRKASTTNQIDEGIWEQRKQQTLVSDVMHVMRKQYLVSVAQPLQLTITAPCKTLDVDGMGQALTSHINLLDSHGFKAKRVIIDPQRGLIALKGKMGDVEIDPVGAGDHLHVVDSCIRRIKETMRCVVSGLPYVLPKNRCDDLVAYASGRKNARRTKALNDNVAPRVKFTGRQIDYAVEYKAGFGDYVEAYNPAVRSNTMQERTEPCIALYPAGNVSGSWILWNMKSRSYVRRSNFKVLATPGRIIDVMNQVAGRDGIQSPDQIDDDPELENEEVVFDSAEDKVADELVLPSVPEETALRRGEELAEKEGNPPEEEEENAVPKIGDDRVDTINYGRGKRSARGVPPDRYAGVILNEGVALTQLSVKKGIDKHGKLAEESICKEFIQLFREKKALKPVKRKDVDMKAVKERIRCSMFLKEKYDGNNKFEKLKSRLVGDGSTQDRNLYPNLSSPTAKLDSIFIVLERSVRQKMFWGKMDIGGAYHNAYLYKNVGDDVIIMIISKYLTEILVKNMPELKEYVDQKSGTMWVQILKAMYGLVQSAALWFEVLSKFLKSVGFVPNPEDECVLVKNDNGKSVVIVLYVDDILVLVDDREKIDWLHKILEDEYETVELDKGDSFTYLGMVISKEKNGMTTVNMGGYTTNIVNDYEVFYKVKEVTTPATQDLFHVGDENKPLNEGEAKVFHTFVARLLYLCKRARPDIQLAVLYLCTRVKGPNVSDKRKLDRVIGFLKRTQNRKRRICGSGDASRLKGYIDSAFSSHDDGSGHTGMVVMWGDTCVMTVCKKQKIATKDSTEAELVGMSDSFAKLEWAHDFIVALGEKLREPIIYQDNMSAITLVLAVPTRRLRTKHLTARNACLHESIVKRNEASLEHKGTKLMVADTFTKPLVGEGFHLLMAVVMGWLTCNKLEELIDARNKGVRWNKSNSTKRN